MRFEEQQPSPSLADLVDRFWAFDVTDQDPMQVDHVVMPDGACNLTLVEPGPGGQFFSSLTGPDAVALRVPVFPPRLARSPAHGHVTFAADIGRIFIPRRADVRRARPSQPLA
jgi:hypothetical protein